MEKQVLHIEKPKAVAVINSIGRENDRETAEQIAEQMAKNESIDPTRTHLNRDLLDGIEHDLTLWERVQKRIKEGYTSNRKIRTDAVRVCDGVFGASGKFFAGMSNEQIYKFGNDFAEFLQQKVGRENIIGCRIHLDEKAGLDEKGNQLYHVHVHFQFVPIKDGKLVRREYGISKHGLSAWHTECARWMQSKGWELERGDERQPWQAPVKHQQPNEYKRNHFSDKVPSVKLEKIMHEIDGRVDISKSLFSKSETAKMDAKDYHKLRDIAGQVVALRHKVEELEQVAKDVKNMKKRYSSFVKSIEDERKALERERLQVSNQNEQAKYKRMQDSLQVKLEQVKQQQAELDRQLMQAEQSQKDAVEIADALILQAMEGGQVKRERWEQLFLDNALGSMKKENPKEYNQLIEKGRKIATSEMHKRQRKQEQNRRTTPQHTRN